MKRARVLVVDDSVVIRRLVAGALAEDPAIDVVGVAANGRIAIDRIEQLDPEVVVLDIEMPEMDGLETLARIRQMNAETAVIMFSTLTEQGASITLEALARGATDYVTKPSGMGGINASMQTVRDELIPRVKAVAGVAPPPEALATPRRVPRRRQAPVAAVEAVGIGISTGGPNALAALIPELRPGLGVPIFVVQHMPPVFTRLLAERLNAGGALPVIEVTEETRVEPDHVYLAPGAHHLEVSGPAGAARVAPTDGPPENSCRPAVDVLFRSLARVYGAGALATVMTGMGQDGALGCEDIVAAGGQVLAQDEASSVVWGMAGLVVGHDLADAVVPLDRMAGEITRRVAHHRTTARPERGVRVP